MPFSVLLSDTVGPGDVLQHTPLAVTVSPPSDITLPPPIAALSVMPATAAVVTSGIAALVLKLRWLPYPVPLLLVA